MKKMLKNDKTKRLIAWLMILLMAFGSMFSVIPAILAEEVYANVPECRNLGCCSILGIPAVYLLLGVCIACLVGIVLLCKTGNNRKPD